MKSSEPILIISGSPRQQSQSRKVSGVIKRLIAGFGIEAVLLDLSLLPLPVAGIDSIDHASSVDTLKSMASSASAIVLICPEWGGMAPASIKNALLLLTDGEIAHKPILLVSVSSGAGGAYPIAELRAFSAKNAHAFYIPHHVIVRDVEKLFLGLDKSEEDIRIEKRLFASIEELITYAEALQPHRGKLKLFRQRYLYGM
jgi:NAD(P)H-dependent FMN reductase